MSPASPMMVAAMTGPTPKMPVQAGAGGADRGGELGAGLAELGVDPPQVGQLGQGELVPPGRDRPGRAGRGQQRRGGWCGGPLGDPAGEEFAQGGVQPARCLGAQPGQVAGRSGPHLQHDGMVIGGNGLAGRRPERGDGHRPGIIRVVLVRAARRQLPDPRAKLGLDVQDLLVGRQELWASR
jgi:hypothetical protein